MSFLDLSKYKFKFKPDYMEITKDGEDLVARNCGPTIYAISSYAGKPVKAKASCHPNDRGDFDEEFGKLLAAARCNEKIARKRMKRAMQKYREAEETFIREKKFFREMEKYLIKSQTEVLKACDYVKELEDSHK